LSDHLLVWYPSAIVARPLRDLAARSDPLNLSRLLFRLFLGKRLPVTRGTLKIPALLDELTIRRDRWGIPALDARNEHDAYFGIGFCHGQDRAFQLEVLLRVVRGTLSELFGSITLPVDRLSRRIGFHHSAREQWPALDDEVRAMLEAYAEGVRAGVTQGLPRRPHEFALLGGQPSAWTALDSLGVLKVTSFSLASNWDAELARWRILQEDGVRAVIDLDPTYPPDLPVTAPPGRAAGPVLDRLQQDLAAFAAVVRPGGGSNNWAIAPGRTATGRPLLANDPHLDAGLPCHWYLARVRCPQWGVAGATFLGGPTVLAGHNGHAAWGLTAGLVDNTDLFLEEIGVNGVSVRQGTDFVSCPVREEVITIKGAPSVTERVLMTPRGPIVTPLLEADGAALSLRALWLDPLPVRGLLTAHRTRSFDEFRREFARWPVTAQNMIYADISGTIGWQLAGQAPRRRSGHGQFPLPGWDPKVGWEEEPVPFVQMPHLQDPTQGFLATANTMPAPEGDGPFLGADWIDGYRLGLINRSLAQRHDWDVPSVMRLQMSQHSLPWEAMRPVILSAPERDDDARAALELLKGWNGELTADSAAAALFELFIAEMAQRIAAARAPKSFAIAMGKGLSPLSRFNFFCFRRTGHLSRLLREQPTGWLDRPWLDEVSDALAAVVRRLRQGCGVNRSHWAWGRLRPLIMHHPLSRSRMLAPIFNLGPIPCGGDTDTIAQASSLPLNPLAPADNIASLRMAIDVGAWHNSRFVLPGGQSGNPLSPHYGDLFPLWQRGEGVPIAWTEEEVREATKETLTLVRQE
jgi:penicillin amidase